LSALHRGGDNSDLRLRRISLTGAGAVLTAQPLDIHVRVIETITTALSVEECEAMDDIVRRVGADLQVRGKIG
jgi:DNA-binding MarR family transcriptional regulator